MNQCNLPRYSPLHLCFLFLLLSSIGFLLVLYKVSTISRKHTVLSGDYISFYSIVSFGHIFNFTPIVDGNLDHVVTSSRDEQFIPTLAIKLAGRLGNVLFQIASGMAIAQHFHLNVCLDSSSYNYDWIVHEVAPLLNEGETL